MIPKVKAATGDTIHVVIDTVSEKETQFTAIKALAEGTPGRLLVILPLVEGISDIRKDVEIICSSLVSHLPYQQGRPMMNATRALHSYNCILSLRVPVRALRFEQRR